MKYVVKSLIITFVMSLLIIMPEKSNSSFDRTPFFDVIEKVEPYPTGGGSINLQVLVTPKFKCDEIILEIVDTYNLTYSGPMIMTEPGQESLSTIFEIPIVIPENDTSGIAFIINKDTKARDGGRIYWVVEEDTVKTFDSDPRRFEIVRLRNKKPVIKYEKDRKEAEGVVNPEGKVTTGYIDEDGNPVPDNKVDEDEKPQPVKIYAPDESLPDSAYVWTIGDDGNLYQVKKADIKRQNEELKLEKRREKMRELEKTPLMDLEVQTFHIGDSAYIRNKGEYKFRLNTKRVDSSNHRRKQSK